MKAQVRTKITFECTECKRRNYDSYKNKRNDPDRLTMSKYCPSQIFRTITALSA